MDLPILVFCLEMWRVPEEDGEWGEKTDENTAGSLCIFVLLPDLRLWNSLKMRTKALSWIQN